MLSGRSRFDGLITRPEESCRVWCVQCDREASIIGNPRLPGAAATCPTRGLLRNGVKKKTQVKK